MKKNLIKILGILILVVLQLSLFSKFSFFASYPNLIYILSIALLLRGFFQDSLLVAILGGFFLDLASPLRFGIYTLILVGVLFVINYLILKNIPAPNSFLIFLIFMGIFLLVNFVIFLIVRAAPDWQIIIDAAVNSLWGILVYFILGKAIKPKEEIKLA